MAVKYAINGFGRIGRCLLRAAFERKDPLDVAVINDIDTPTTLAHLFKYDSVHGNFRGEVKAEEGAITINGKRIQVTAEKDASKLPWASTGVGVVLECSGKYTEREAAEKHLAAGAKKVLVSAPAKRPDLTVVMGVNHQMYDPAKHHIISNASCTTNCLTPMARVLMDNFRINRGLMTTIHSYTNDQRILDQPHKDLRRARAAAMSMIPTSTGAAKAVGEVMPELKGKLDGLAIRVPTPNVSLVDLVVEIDRDTNKQEVNLAMRTASEGPLKGILKYSEDQTVSCDYNNDPHSCIFDALDTYVMDRRLVKVMGWYDNEWGYSERMVDLARLVAEKGI